MAYLHSTGGLVTQVVAAQDIGAEVLEPADAVLRVAAANGPGLT